jgi:protein-tyrosine phosphatase
MSSPERHPVVEYALTFVRRYTTIIRIRRFLRDVWWSVAGRSLKNPTVPTAVGSILFVCKGNICRSPFAGALARRYLSAAQSAHLGCHSAGITASQAARPPQVGCDAAAAYETTLLDHRPELLTEALMAAHGMVVVMEASQLHQLRRQYAQFHDRLFLLPLFERESHWGFQRYNIADPYGHPAEAYAACYRRIDNAIRALLPLLVRADQNIGPLPSSQQEPRSLLDSRSLQTSASG